MFKVRITQDEERRITCVSAPVKGGGIVYMNISAFLTQNEPEIMNVAIAIVEYYALRGDPGQITVNLQLDRGNCYPDMIIMG